jgi:hypothetical protein
VPNTLEVEISRNDNADNNPIIVLNVPLRPLAEMNNSATFPLYAWFLKRIWRTRKQVTCYHTRDTQNDN